jgi:hypothetical protein
MGERRNAYRILVGKPEGKRCRGTKVTGMTKNVFKGRGCKKPYQNGAGAKHGTSSRQNARKSTVSC